MKAERPKTLINGERCHALAASDRGLAYGHGVFETILLLNGYPILWRQHMARLLQGCARLDISVSDTLEASLLEDFACLHLTEANAVIKVVISAGSGGRGYKKPEPMNSQRIVTLFSMPHYPVEYSEHGIKIITCDYRLPHNRRLAGIKHLNRLDQVLARAEWQDINIAEGIILDYENNVVEGTMSNLFSIKNGVLLTPSLEQAGVKGVMRGFIIKTASSIGLPVKEVNLGVKEFKQADEIFVTNSVIGLWPVKQWDNEAYEKGLFTGKLQQRIEGLFKRT